MTQTTLALWFTRNGERIELERSKFGFAGSSESALCVRGKCGGAYLMAGSFQWTSAVQALCILIVNHKHYYSCPRESRTLNEEYITGGAASPAASLDYAISKQPLWILDFFGVDDSGLSRTRKLLIRTNPERKRAGSVTIRVKHSALPADNIEIFLDERKLMATNELLSLLETIRKQFGAEGNRGMPTSVRSAISSKRSDSTHQLSSNLAVTVKSILKHEYFREVRESLFAGGTISRTGIAKAERRLNQNPSFVRLAGANRSLRSQIDVELTESNQLGTTAEHSDLERSLKDGKPILCAVSPAHAGTLAILTYLKKVKGYNIDINFKFTHSVELLKQILANSTAYSPHIVSLTVATTGSLLGYKGKCEYSPFMIMPKQSHGIIHKDRSSRRVKSNRYLFMSDIPGTESFYFDELIRRQYLKRDRSSSHHMEPVDVTALLKSADPEVRAIIGFPHYNLNRDLNGCEVEGDPYSEMAMMETVLVAHDSFINCRERAKHFDIAIRDAWLTLMEDSDSREAAVQTLLDDDDYLKVVRRAVGLWQINSHSTAPHVAGSQELLTARTAAI